MWMRINIEKKKNEREGLVSSKETFHKKHPIHGHQFYYGLGRNPIILSQQECPWCLKRTMNMTHVHMPSKMTGEGVGRKWIHLTHNVTSKNIGLRVPGMQ